LKAAPLSVGPSHSSSIFAHRGKIIEPAELQGLMAWEQRLVLGFASDIVDLLDQNDLQQLLLKDLMLAACYGSGETCPSAGCEVG
jgi:hypothetical protein